MMQNLTMQTCLKPKDECSMWNVECESCKGGGANGDWRVGNWRVESDGTYAICDPFTILYYPPKNLAKETIMRTWRTIGSEPWHRTLAIAFLAQLMAGLGFSLVFPFLPLYVQHLGIRTGGSVEFWSGIVFAVQAFTMMLSAPIWGSLADRYGRKLMVQRATFGGAVILLAMGFARSAEELALLRAIQGLITGTVTATIALVAAATPRKHSGFALGLLQVALWAGIAVGPVIGGIMADTVGFRATFVLTSVLLFLAGVLVHFGIHEPPRTTSASQQRISLLESWRNVLHLPGVLPTFAVRFLNNLSRMSVMPMLPLFIQSLMSNSNTVGTVTGLVSGVGSAMSTFSAVVLGRIGDKVGHKRVLVASALLAAVGYFPQALATSPWQLVVLNAIAGAAVGGILPALGALLAQYSPPGQEGAVYGLDASVGSAGRTVAPLTGSAIAMWFGIRETFIFAGVVFVLAALLALRLPPPPEETIPEEKEIEKTTATLRPLAR